MICHINFRILKVCNIFPMKSENLNFRGYRIFAFKAKENRLKFITPLQRNFPSGSYPKIKSYHLRNDQKNFHTFVRSVLISQYFDPKLPDYNDSHYRGVPLYSSYALLTACFTHNPSVWCHKQRHSYTGTLKLKYTSLSPFERLVRMASSSKYFLL